MKTVLEEITSRMVEIALTVRNLSHATREGFAIRDARAELLEERIARLEKGRAS